MEEFKYLGRLTGVLGQLYGSFVVKTELSQEAKQYIYKSISIPSLTRGHEPPGHNCKNEIANTID